MSVERDVVVIAVAGRLADCPTAAAVRDVAELLEVGVDRLAGSGAFVAADRLAGGPDEPGRASQAVAHQGAGHGRGREAEGRPDPTRPGPGLRSLRSRRHRPPPDPEASVNEWFTARTRPAPPETGRRAGSVRARARTAPQTLDELPPNTGDLPVFLIVALSRFPLEGAGSRGTEHQKHSPVGPRSSRKKRHSHLCPNRGAIFASRHCRSPLRRGSWMPQPTLVPRADQ
ncbi:hypothetical protein CP979_04260 [Streptomyces filamentosus]|nr:hypothetical protein CP979_04260 [Streptomyces filamentosus]